MPSTMCCAGGWGIEAAENIDQRGFAGAGGAHDGNPFAVFDAEGDTVESAHVAELFAEVFDLDDRGHVYRRWRVCRGEWLEKTKKQRRVARGEWLETPKRAPLTPSGRSG